MNSTAACEIQGVVQSQACVDLFNENGEPVTTPRGSDLSCTARRAWQGTGDLSRTDGWVVLPAPQILQRLEAIEKLQINWDSYGSEAPSRVAVAAARSLIWTLDLASVYARGKRVDPYAILPLAGGGVQIEWRGEDRAIEVEVTSDGSFGYLLARGREPGCEFEEMDGVPRIQIVELIWSVIQ